MNDTIKIQYAYIKGGTYGAIRVDEGDFKPYAIEPLYKQIAGLIRALCGNIIRFN